MSPLVSIIIPVHNNGATIVDQLDAVAASIPESTPTEIIVVDNKSTDDGMQRVEDWSSRTAYGIRIVPAIERANEPYARNVGVHAARGDIILFCDGDDVVATTWVTGMIEALSTSDYATGPLDTRMLNPTWLAEVRGAALMQQRPLLSERIPFAHGCNIGLRRDTIEQLGGFDERFVAGCDIEIGIRAWRAGIDLAFHPGAVVHYRLRQDVRAMYRQGRSYGRIQPLLRQASGVAVDSEEWKKRAKRLLWIIRNLPLIVERERRTRWLWVVAQVDGEIRGSIRYRRWVY